MQPATCLFVLLLFCNLLFAKNVSLNIADFKYAPSALLKAKADTPTAAFTCDTTTVVVGDTVHFTDLSTSTSGPITSWHWYFAGGAPDTSTQQNPQIKYNTAGVYNVALKVTDTSGNDSLMKPGYITVIEPSILFPDAKFTADFTTILVGDSINFFDMTHGEPLSWFWKFKGGTPSTSTLQDPVYIKYNTAGTYDVTLTATNTLGSDSLRKQGYIHVLTDAGTVAPTADFSAGPRLAVVGQEITFTDESTNNPLQWQWYFPDGTPATSDIQNPMGVTYNTTGFKNVTLTATNPNGSGTLTKTEYILVTTAQIPSYCDTLTNVLQSELITFYQVPSSSGMGYLPGSNKYGKIYAEKFSSYSFNEVNRIIISVRKRILHLNTTSYVTFKIWGGTTTPAGTALGSVNVNLSNTTLVPNCYNQINFTVPVPIDGTFFVGYDLSHVTSPDTVVFNMALDRGMYGNNTMYVYNSGTWKTCQAVYNKTSSLDLMIIPCLTGVNEVKTNDNIIIFPNPAGDFAVIDLGEELSGKVDVKVYDMMGKPVGFYITKMEQNQYRLDFTNLINGIYFINVTMGNRMITSKISILK